MDTLWAIADKMHSRIEQGKFKTIGMHIDGLR